MKLLIIENPRPLTFEHYNDVANAPLSASLNSGYALAIAQQSGWQRAYLDFSAGSLDTATMADRVLAEHADLILVHWVYAWGNEKTMRALLERLRQNGDVCMGAFGLFPTLSCSQLFQYAPQLDFILAGEFEETLTELLAGFNSGVLKPIPGLARRGEPFLPRPLIDDLSRLPIPADAGANLGYTSLNIAASRGCYGDCSFCFIKPYYGCGRRRVRDVPSLERELDERLSRRPVKSLYFIDPTFIAPGLQERERIIAISRVARAAGLPFGFETRVDTVEEELLTILSRNGAGSIFLGIESGCNSVLQRIGKRITREQIKKAVRIVRNCGLQLNIGFIMFEPDTTLDELRENYAFLEELGLLNDVELTVNLLYHNQIILCGSPAWENFEREGRLLLDDRLPFEARYRFQDKRVQRVCEAMGQLASIYFLGMDNFRRSAGAFDVVCPSGDEINLLLREAFLALCASAGEGSYNRHLGTSDYFSKHLQCIFANVKTT